MKVIDFQLEAGTEIRSKINGFICYVLHENPPDASSISLIEKSSFMLVTSQTISWDDLCQTHSVIRREH